MEESMFEQIDERTVSFYVNVLAVLLPAAAIAIGALMGRRKAQPGRCIAKAVLYGLLGPIVCMYWHLYDARTSYYDWLYLEHNPETYERLFWIGRPGSAARARADAAEKAGGKGVIIVEGRWSPPRFWGFVQPYPLYSVRGLGMFALATLLAASALGLTAGVARRLIDRRWPSGDSPPEPTGQEPREGSGANP